MQCVGCGAELIPGKSFCHQCGTRAVQACPNCGVSLQPGFRFCPDCGFRLGSEPPVVADGGDVNETGIVPAQPSTGSLSNDRLDRLSKHMPTELAQRILASKGAMAGERKLVTVLFCDLVGSTAIAERLDPEEYHDLLEQYLALAFREIYRFDGIVNQLAGDGLMALFGAPVAHEDAPQRAVRAALAIRSALEAFNQPALENPKLHGRELNVRVGIHTGPVVVGTVGNDFKTDYTATGDTTNLAARLQTLAQPGSILVSEATHRLVRGLFDVQAMGTFEVKGKSEPVAAYAVLGVGEAVSPMEIAEARGLTPFVGRSAELGQLMACYERLNTHLGQVVALVGEAGSGKSRLLYEFRRRLARENVILFEARCSSLSQVQPYAPWINMLKHYFGLSATDTDERACEKVARKLRATDGNLDRVYPYLCRMLSFPVDHIVDLPADEILREQFGAVAKLVGSLSVQAPVIMVFEDLHWIDEGSREMLELAAREIQSARVMLIVSHRPDYQSSWRTHAALTQLHLRRLSDADITEVVRAVADGPLPAELEQLIRAKAEGNPFFAEELARALIEEGNVVLADGHLQLTRPVEQIRIPGTVEEVIGARVDRLGPDAKRVIQVAAVLGRQFHRAQLAQLLAGEGIDVDSQLEELEQRGVIHRKTVLSDDEFRFGESLTQEVAYQTLLLRERRQLHERIGQCLEAQPGGRTAESTALLAHHFARSNEPAKALPALLQAAQQAEELPSYRTAAEFYRQAWRLADSVLGDGRAAATLRRQALDAAQGWCRMAVLYATPGDPAEVEAAARQGRELAQELGDDAAVASFCTYQGMIIQSSGRTRFAEGLAIVEEGLAVARRAGLADSVVSISRGVAWSYQIDGRFQAARRTLEWVVTELERGGHRERVSDLYLGSCFMRDTAYYLGDDLPAALASLSQTHELAVAAGNRTIQSGCASTIASIHLLHGEYETALQWAEHSLEVAETIGSVAALRTAAIVSILARVELGQPVTATRHLELLEQGFISPGDMASKSWGAIQAYLALGEFKRAQRFAELAEAHAGGRLREATSAVAIGDVLHRLGAEHWDEAQHRYSQAITLAEEIGSRSILAAANLGAGELAAARGDRSSAASRLGQSLALFRDLGMAGYARRAERVLAEVEAGAEAPA